MDLICQQSGMVQDENPKSSNGVTWACEVGDQTMFCPLLIEDLSVPGQMLIEVNKRHFHSYVMFPWCLTYSEVLTTNTRE